MIARNLTRASGRMNFRDAAVHAQSKLGSYFVQLRLQPFANRLAQHRETPIAPLLPADMREAKEVGRLRFPFSEQLPVSSREWSELQKARLLRMQFKVELSHAFFQFRSRFLVLHRMTFSFTTPRRFTGAP